MNDDDEKLRLWPMVHKPFWKIDNSCWSISFHLVWFSVWYVWRCDFDFIIDNNNNMCQLQNVMFPPIKRSLPKSHTQIRNDFFTFYPVALLSGHHRNVNQNKFIWFEFFFFLKESTFFIIHLSTFFVFFFALHLFFSIGFFRLSVQLHVHSPSSKRRPNDKKKNKRKNTKNLVEMRIMFCCFNDCLELISLSSWITLRVQWLCSCKS